MTSLLRSKPLLLVRPQAQVANRAMARPALLQIRWESSLASSSGPRAIWEQEPRAPQVVLV